MVLADNPHRVDKSQKGNGENLRNESFNGRPFDYRTGWQLPRSGILSVDYVSPLRPDASAQPMSDAEFTVFMEAFVTLREMPKEEQTEMQRIFAQFDLDGNGTIERGELRAVLESFPMTSVEAIRRGLHGDADTHGAAIEALIEELVSAHDDDGSLLYRIFYRMYVR